MLLVAGSVLAVYFAVDRRQWRREAPAVRERPMHAGEKLHLRTGFCQRGLLSLRTLQAGELFVFKTLNL